MQYILLRNNITEGKAKELLIAQVGDESAISKAKKKWRVYESTQKVVNRLYR